MAHSDPPSEHDKSKKEGSMKPGPITLQRTRAGLFKVVSYFSGDMQVFGKWMESKSAFLNEKIES